MHGSITQLQGIKQIFLPLLMVWLCASCNNEQKRQDHKPLKVSDFNSLKPLHKTIGNIEVGDWLSQNDEETESFKYYRSCKPHRPTPQNRTIYIRPLGTFSAVEDSLVNQTVEFLEAFYGLPIKCLPSVSDSIVPKGAQRIHHGAKQYHSRTILNGYLHKYFPDDAVAYICITNTDLYPKKSWNFVFGQANIRKHVAVSSMARYKYDEFGEPTSSKFRLERIMSTMAHETGHLFRLMHCATFKCLMNGSNSLEESIEKPSWLCPDCLVKLSWNLNYDAILRFKQLEAFYSKYGFEKKKVFCEKSRVILQGKEVE